MSDKGMFCDTYVPEGRQICPKCERDDERNPMFNSSGCKDLTAYNAVKNLTDAENALSQRASAVIGIIKDILRLEGYELIRRVQIRDKKTGTEFK